METAVGCERTLKKCWQVLFMTAVNENPNLSITGLTRHNFHAYGTQMYIGRWSYGTLRLEAGA